ncbi:MAG: 50S ribosomal protein L3 [Desulfovibrionaceae bacterium]|nr:50S ribosomal protein L3 [Desulfovibrionaceae bacterium]
MSGKKGIMGKKIGMTQVFGDDGRAIAVTVIQAGPCYVGQVKDEEKEGYKSIQLFYDECNISKVNKPMQGHFHKHGFEKGFKHIKEFAWFSPEAPEVGSVIDVSIFSVGDFISVTGVSKGKGTQGVMKRWGFSGMPATHGNEKTPRSGGSIGNNTFPGKVFKGKKMAGRMGNETVTRSNLQVIAVYLEKNIILVKGPVPGSKNSLVILSKQ